MTPTPLQGNPLTVTKIKGKLGANHGPSYHRPVVTSHKHSIQHSSEWVSLTQRLLTSSGERLLPPVRFTSSVSVLPLLTPPPELVKKRGGSTTIPSQVEKQGG